VLFLVSTGWGISTMPEMMNIIYTSVLILVGTVFLLLNNYIKYSEKVELFVAQYESQATAAKDKLQKV
jgi:hypothetical protein